MDKNDRPLLIRAGVAVASLAAALIGIGVVRSIERGRVESAVAAEIAGTEARARELVTAHLAALELAAFNAGSNPRLVAAVSGNVSRETLRDVFLHESWWQPFRSTFSSFYLARTSSPRFVAGRELRGIENAPPFFLARQQRRVASALMLLSNKVVSVVAVPITLPSSALTPVLVLARPFESEALARLAGQLGGAALLSDGTAALLTAGTQDQTAALRRALETRSTPAGSGDAVGVAKVGPGLQMVVQVPTGAAVARAAGGYAAVRLAIGLAGCMIFVASILSLLRAYTARAALERLSQGAPTPINDAGSARRYLLVDRLGAGGMAEQHLAVAIGESEFRRPCVVKRLRPEMLDDAEAVLRFSQEAAMASSLIHANIVATFDFARHGAEYFLVQEYIAGRDLGRIVRRLAPERTLTAPMLAHVAVEVCKALAYAHGKRGDDGEPLAIVHRDVSPDNIMISLAGEVRLLDFGLAMTAGDQRMRTDGGSLRGHLRFMSPEQTRALEIDARADLFALGLVLYYCLTGESLYQEVGGYDLLTRAANGPDAALLGKLDDLPRPFPTILRKALAPRPHDRYQSADELADDLADWAGGGPSALTALMHELFEDELREEQKKLGVAAKSVPAGRTGDHPAIYTGSSPDLPVIVRVTPPRSGRALN